MQGEKKNTIDKTSGYANTSSDWILQKSDFTETNYGFELIHIQKDTPQADIFFRVDRITHSVF